jgi:uncharacterized protein
MKLNLKKKPKNVTIIEGFPGFGLVATITIEYLIKHLKTEKIGTIEVDELPAITAIHGGKVIEPISLHYDKKHNLVLVHALNVNKQIEWKMAEMIEELASKLTAKEIISIEGVGSPNSKSRVFYYDTHDHKKFKDKIGEMALPLNEGVVVGVTGALLSKELKLPMKALFVEAESNLPDSRGAAEIIKVLDAYTTMNVDPKPLLKEANVFEEKLKDILRKNQKAEGTRDDKWMGYVG